MVCENTKDRSPLLPVRHEQEDFFVCDIFDAAPKSDMASMEHPVFSLSTKPDTRPRQYNAKDGVSYVEIKPSSDGLATVHDRDILIYCISQIIAALNDNKPVHKTLRFKAYDLLVATNRGTDGRGYQQLRAAFERLRGTTISTNIMTGGVEQFDVFGLIDRARIIRETRDGRMLDVEITLSDWVFNAIQEREVLTLNRRYFQLRKPLERRLYELARKHCGRQSKWLIGLKLLREKTGSNSSMKEFKRLLGKIIKDDETHSHMPDYAFRIDRDNLCVTPKPEFVLLNEEPNARISVPPLNPDTYEKGREAAPGWDIHYLEREWRDWMKERPKRPDSAFIGFCRSWYEKRGDARNI